MSFGNERSSDFVWKGEGLASRRIRILQGDARRRPAFNCQNDSNRAHAIVSHLLMSKK